MQFAESRTSDMYGDYTFACYHFDDNMNLKERSMYKNRFRWSRTIVVLLTLVLVVSCKKEENQPEAVQGNSGDLIAYNKVATISANDILTFNQAEGDFTGYANHAIDVYNIEYKSKHQGSLIKVSGLVMVPLQVGSPVGLIQHHHGTIMPPDKPYSTPSLFTGFPVGDFENSEITMIGAVFASNGYVVSLPDYVGYGATSGAEHPYTIHRELATVSIDMLRATKKLMTAISVQHNGKVMLTGWSEGGGAGLATHKYLQLEHPGEFDVKGSSLLAGPYDYKAFINDVLSNPGNEWGALQIYNWAMYAMNKYNNLGRPADQIWTYPVSNQLEAIAVPSLKPEDVWTPSFISNVVSNSDTELIAILDAQTLINGWTPQGKVFLHSGTNDLIVPHYNSTNANQAFLQVGADVALYEYQGGDHYTPAVQYVKKTLDDFDGL